MYPSRIQKDGFKYSQEVRVKNGWLMIKTRNNKTFNIFSGGKEIDIFTDYSNRYPGAKISDWLKDNQNYFG